MIIFWTIAVVLWKTTGKIFYLYNFGYIGTALGVGFGVYSALPKRQKLWGRRLAQFLVGTYMLVFLGLFQRENMQLEGFFFYLLAGLFAGSVIHYLVAKIAGPIVFNRGWCGWACWTAMVLDLLPYKRYKQGRLRGKWGYLRYAHFALSLGLVLVLWFGLKYRSQSQSLTELSWLVGGNVLYTMLLASGWRMLSKITGRFVNMFAQFQRCRRLAVVLRWSKSPPTPINAMIVVPVTKCAPWIFVSPSTF